MTCDDYYEKPAPVFTAPAKETPKAQISAPEAPKVKTPGIKAVRKQLAAQKKAVEETEARLAELNAAERKRPRKKKISVIREESPAPSYSYDSGSRSSC